MNTPIGQCLRSNTRFQVAFSISALLIILIDLWLVRQAAPIWARIMLAAVVLVVYLVPGSIDRTSLGLHFTPIQSITYWIRMIILIGVIMLIPIMVYLLLANALGWKLSIPQLPPDQAGLFFLYGCVLAPFLEEVIYRLVLCFPATSIICSLGAILFSGAVFAGVHFLYGTPGPDNFFAGYVLAWVYLKSGSIIVSMIIHSLGNFVILIFYLGAWYVT